MPFYESVFIARQEISAAQVDGIADSFGELIDKHGGRITKREYWGLKNLAYRIKKNRKGHYVLFNIDAPLAAVQEFERGLRFHEDILRHLTVKLDELDDQPSAMMQGRTRERAARERRDRDERPDSKAEDSKLDADAQQSASVRESKIDKEGDATEDKKDEATTDDQDKAEGEPKQATSKTEKKTDVKADTKADKKTKKKKPDENLKEAAAAEDIKVEANTDDQDKAEGEPKQATSKKKKKTDLKADAKADKKTKKKKPDENVDTAVETATEGNQSEQG